MTHILESISLSALVTSALIILVMYIGVRLLNNLPAKKQGRVVPMKTEVDISESFYTEQSF
jgi:hypothetical protein